VTPEPDIRRRITSRLLALPPRAFELFAGDLLVFVGLQDVAVTRYSGDGGIDATGSIAAGDGLIRIPAGVQVKRHRANVQRPDIDRFIGALTGLYPQGIFITTAGFAPQAARKAAGSIPRVATLGGAQVAELMLRGRLGVAGAGGPAEIDEEYFGQLEAAAARPARVADPPAPYSAGAPAAAPEDDLISLRALSHALRVDPSVIRRWLERGRLSPDLAADGAGRGLFFRRDRVAAISAELLGAARPATPEAWRQEFLDFARSRNLSKSYKPVLVKALLATVGRDGEAAMADIVREFRAFYRARREAGLPVEFGPPDVSDPAAVSDARLRQLIVQNPLERFLIKGFLEYLPEAGVVRFAPQLWAELRAYELLDLRRSADEQLAYYYARG
jgi:hypothetical protein